jgi:hypothetical protein
MAVSVGTGGAVGAVGAVDGSVVGADAIAVGAIAGWIVAIGAGETVGAALHAVKITANPIVTLRFKRFSVLPCIDYPPWLA